ncbi:hypothetical protein Hamer_G014039, partial [Homarus americanus]
DINKLFIYQYKEININELLSEYQEIETSNVSIANPDRLQQLQEEIALDAAKTAAAAAAIDAGAVGGVPDGAVGGADAAAVDIDEELFDGDDEDLDELDEQLEEMTVS